MSLLTKMKYSFTSTGMDKETFTVVSFTGYEAVSKPYKFEILLVSEKTDINPLDVLQNPAVFTIHRDQEDDVKFNGILMQFEEIQEFDGYLFFKAVLTPKLWWLSLTHHNQVFLDMSAPDIMENALKDGGLNSGLDFSFNLMNSYQPFEYICQYDESHFNFVSRWAEREGMYYFFEQGPNGEKVIFTDSKMEHKDLLLGKDLIYLPQSGLDALHTKEVIQSFICRHNMLPQKVYLKDYNYLKPSFAIEGMADVDKDGRGENYIYGVNFDTPEEGNRLAQIRAEALLCRKSIFHGESSVPFIVPGYTFDLNDHYKNAYNRKYLVSEVTHEGHQKGYLLAGLSKAFEKSDEDMFYSNSFTAIYSDEQFRPEHISEKPKISGTINAKIDAAGSGEHAELDEHGRYKVILPFDRSGRFGGKASAWFRMMQPSAGLNQGMHFPLHKGTEVLLTFIDGNPDRPVIAGAMPNPETSSPVKDENQTKSIIRTGRSPVNQSVGAASNRHIRHAINVNKGNIAENASDIAENEGDIADNSGDIAEIKNNFIELDDGAGNERIIIHSDGDLWFQARDRYTEYTIGGPVDKNKVPTEVQYLWDKFYSASPDFAPIDMQAYDYAAGAGTTASSVDVSSMKSLAKKGKVNLIKGDTFNTQEGNIYDFGGYWNYNLGNSYVENYMSQAAKLNDVYDKDLLNKGGPGWNNVDWSKALGYGQTCVPDSDPPDWDFNSDRMLEEGDVKIGADADWEEATAGEADTSVWVEKSFGNSYSYKDGDSIDVTSGNALDILHAHEQVDIVFRESGAIKSWEKSDSGTLKAKNTWDSKGRLTSEMTYGDGILNETTWNYFAKGKSPGELPKLSQKTVDKNSGTTSVHTHCRDTGNIIAYSSVHQGANSKHSFNFNWANTAKASFNFAAGAAFSFNASEQGSINISLAATQSLNLKVSGNFSYNYYGAVDIAAKAYLAAKLDVALYASASLLLETSASIDCKLKTGLGVVLDLDMRNNAKIEYDAPSQKFKLKILGTEVEKGSLELCWKTLKLNL
jgi:type VI secretion system VgrG family protein